MFLKKIGLFLLNLVCPPTCPICGVEVDEAHCLCPACYGQMKFLTPPCCQICGRPFEYAGLGDIVCGACMKKKPYYTMARSILAYDDFSKQLILAFKHGDRTELAPILCKFLSLSDPAIFENVDMIIPVPLHWSRRFKRMYNQSGILGVKLGKVKKIPCCLNVLKRVRPTESQGHKHRKERERNVRKAFVVASPKSVRDKTILLIDDVMTTGATLNECAKVLKQAGAKEIKVITLYRVLSL